MLAEKSSPCATSETCYIPQAHPTYLVERVNLNGGLRHAGESALGTLACGAETAEGTGVIRDVELRLALELVLEVLEERVVEVLTTQVSVTGSRLDGEDTTRDVQKGHIESTTTEIEDEDVLLRLRLTVKTVGDGGGGRLVDDTEDVKTGDRTGVLGRQTLRVVEVGGDAENLLSMGPCTLSTRRLT